MQGARTGGAYDWDLDYPSPSMPRVYVLLDSAAVGDTSGLEVAILVPLPHTDRAPDSGGAQAGGDGGESTNVVVLRTAALPFSALHRLCPLAV